MNWAAWTILVLTLLNLILMPFLWGGRRGPYGWDTLVSSILYLILLLFAFDILTLST